MLEVDFFVNFRISNALENSKLVFFLCIKSLYNYFFIYLRIYIEKDISLSLSEIYICLR